jgi:RNA polymerase sigma-70 factor (ECF subfamily)
MAFLVVLQRLTPAERAVLLLHDVFDMSHAEIGALLAKNDAACRQLLKRARENVSAERRVFETSREEHRRLLQAFIAAATSGDQASLLDILAEDAVLVVDPGDAPARFGRLREIRRPVVGRQKVLAIIRSFASQDAYARIRMVERTLNGETALVTFLDGRVLSAMLVSVADGKIRHIFLQGDPVRLRHIGDSR